MYNEDTGEAWHWCAVSSPEQGLMSSGVYLGIMLGVIAVCTGLAIPSLFRQKCPKCGTRNSLEAKQCKRCQTPFEGEG